MHLTHGSFWRYICILYTFAYSKLKISCSLCACTHCKRMYLKIQLQIIVNAHITVQSSCTLCADAYCKMIYLKIHMHFLNFLHIFESSCLLCADTSCKRICLKIHLQIFVFGHFIYQLFTVHWQLLTWHKGNFLHIQYCKINHLLYVLLLS